MLWSAYALGTRALLWFEHGCFGHCMLSEHERYYGCYIRRVAAKAFSPNLYTLDPKVQPNDIAAKLFALLRRSSSDALSFLFWRTKGLPANSWEKTENSAQATIVEVSSLLFSVFKTVSAQNTLQIDWFSVNRKILQFRAFKSTCLKNPEVRKAWRTHVTCTKYCKYQ